MLCRVGAAEGQQDEYHDAENCAEEDKEAGKPLLQGHANSQQEEVASSSAYANGSCDKQYWTCPGDAGFKVQLMPWVTVIWNPASTPSFLCAAAKLTIPACARLRLACACQ